MERSDKGGEKEKERTDKGVGEKEKMESGRVEKDMKIEKNPQQISSRRKNFQ